MKKILSNLKNLILITFFIIVLLYSNYDFTNNNKKTFKRIDDTTYPFEIHFIDVGEAECILVKENNNYLLVDGGNTIDAGLLVEYLKSLNIENFKYVIATHPHEDHIGGLHYIMRKIKTDKVLMTDIKVDSKSYHNLINTINEENIEVEIPSIDNVYPLENTNIKILSLKSDFSNINDSSIVIKINYKNTNYLLTADISKEVELELINKDIESDVLKIAHHGSNNASSAQFLKKVNPEFAVISVGSDNEYFHPHKIVLDKLDYLNIKTFRTDIHNTIIFKTDGKNIFYETKKTNTNK